MLVDALWTTYMMSPSGFFAVVTVLVAVVVYRTAAR